MVDLVVEQVPIDALLLDPTNPRKIGEEELDSLERSLRQFGFVQPVVARREDRTVIGGHQRLVAARRLGLTTVPVIWLDLAPEQARLLGLALNRISGSWDEALLARLLADLQATPDLDLTLSGFGQDEVRDLLRSLEVREKRERPEAFDLEAALEEARRSPRATPGDVWQLGEHRVCCGDATDPVAVARLLDGAEPVLLSTDPPYGVSYDPTWRDRAGYNALGPAEAPYMRMDAGLPADLATQAPTRARGRTRGHRHTQITGDTRVDWSEAFELVPSLKVGYVWHAGVHAAEVAAGLERIGFEIVSQLVWDKGLFAIGRSWYHWNHEPAWVVRKRGAKVPFRGSRDQATIWRAPSPKMIMSGSDERKEDHPTQKPLILFETPIRNHLKGGEGVYDPFLGSGTCLIAPNARAPSATGWRSIPSSLRSSCDASNGSVAWRRSGSMAEQVDGSPPDAALRLAALVSTPHARGVPALALLTARRPALHHDLARRGGTPVSEFVATLSDEEREILCHVIDAELARREAETADLGPVESPTR